MTASGERPSELSESARTNVLLEGLRSDFKVYGEGMAFIQARIARMEPKLDNVAEDMAIIKPLVKRNTRDIASIKKSIGRIEKRLTSVEERTGAVENRVTTLEVRPA